MNLEDVLKALTSCGINPEAYDYGHDYYIKNNKYYRSFPDDFDRPSEIIHEEIKSESEFIERFLTHISMSNRKLCPLIYVLSSLCCHQSEYDLRVRHETLFELYNPLWHICQKMDYEDHWKYNVISHQGELFNQTYNYGIGFIDGKYVVERQNAVQVYAAPNTEYDSYVFDNYHDAFLQLKKYADSEILKRQIAVDKFIKSYEMDNEEHDLAQEVCDLLNDKFENSVDRFAINTTNANNVVYVRDYGYYSFRANENKAYGSVRFHANGKHMPSVIRNFCETYKTNA